MELSTLEQSCPRGYVRPLFCFSTTLENDIVCDLLSHGLAKTKEAVPMLSHQLVKDTDAQQGGLYKLAPSYNSGKFHVKDLRGGKFKPTYEELKKKHFPTSALPQDVLCPLPVFPREATGIPVFAAQATLIDGGLILSFCIMHLVADARTIFEILKIWAQNCRHLQDPVEAHSCQQLPVDLFEKEAFTRDIGCKAPLKDHNTSVLQHPDYKVYGSPPPPPPALLNSNFRTQIFRITSSSLKRLKKDVAAGLDSGPEISTHDAIFALIWCCVLAAQVDYHSSDTMSLNTICVDGRTRCSDPLPGAHIGCPMMYAIPRLGVRELLDPGNVAKAARSIRTAVNAIDGNAISLLVDFLSRVPSYDFVVPVTFDGLMDTSIMTSSWFKLPFYKIHWGKMFADGLCDRVRIVHEGFFNGSQVILPELPTDEMEVVIGLDMRHWTAFESNELWRKYTIQEEA
ncbi:hypothetical protein KCU99_g9271, partial [Aureobasidium melanogenum]